MEANKMAKEKNYIWIIDPDKKSITGEILITVPNYPKLKAALNDGMLEIVPYFNKFYGRDCVAFCDEEGKMKNLTVNKMAMEFWERAVGKRITGDYLVGNIVIVVGSKSFLNLL
jgi:hypothetical protein